MRQPSCKRKQQLLDQFAQLLEDDLENRVLGMDALAAARKAQGKPVATRNVRHFPDLTVPVINPWEAR